MRHAAIILALLVALNYDAAAYPLYGSEDTGIRRLEQARLAHEGQIDGRQKVTGELLSVEQVDLRLLEQKNLELPTPDSDFTAQILGLLDGYQDRYSIAVLDLSDLSNVRYAEYNGAHSQNPGSVGKLVVAAAIFQALADTHPDDPARRLAVLRDTTVTADEFIIRDSHTVRLWDPASQVLTRRPLEIGDQASLWEFLDWMLSPSSNAAAAIVQRETMLLRHFAEAYPQPFDVSQRFFNETPKQELGQLFTTSFEGAVTRNGLDIEGLRQGSFFTRTGKAKVPGTNSYATSRELMKFVLHMEQGKIVDEFSSREIKRLLYVTERRIRYASSPALRDAAVYFKSGSFYKCEAEEGFTCKKYMGNKLNLMNSVAIVESPAGNPRLFYMVTLLSNVLRKNSAVDHQTLATRIHQLIEQYHAAPQ
jgi:hypothetical protein